MSTKVNVNFSNKKNRLPNNEVIHRIKYNAQMIKLFLRQCEDEIILSSRVSDITGDLSEITRDEALRNVVNKKLSVLDHYFLISIDAYANLSEKKRHNRFINIP